jgi:hypothetical protein
MAESNLARKREEMPLWLVGILEAGREMATRIEENIRACSRSKPHNIDTCPYCLSNGRALLRWMNAVWSAQRHFDGAAGK